MLAHWGYQRGRNKGLAPGAGPPAQPALSAQQGTPAPTRAATAHSPRATKLASPSLRSVPSQSIAGLVPSTLTDCLEFSDGLPAEEQAGGWHMPRYPVQRHAACSTDAVHSHGPQAAAHATVDTPAGLSAAAGWGPPMRLRQPSRHQSAAGHPAVAPQMRGTARLPSAVALRGGQLPHPAAAAAAAAAAAQAPPDLAQP